MTFFPKYLTRFPNMDSRLPIHLSVNRLERGFESHRHDFLEFSYVLSGEGAESIDGVLHPMTPGTFTFVLPHQFHEIHAGPGSPLVLINCNFGINIFMEIGLESGLSRMLDRVDHHAASYIRFTGKEEEQMRRLLGDMVDEYEGDRLWRPTMLKSLLTEVLVRFDRKRNDAFRHAAPAAGAGESGGALPAPQERQIGKVVHYLHTHYREPLTLSALADHYRISASHFSEWFKRSTGQTFLHFLQDIRLRHSCALLANTDLSVTEIALEVGYGSYKTFTRIFHDKKGITPRAYRSQYRTPG